MGGSSSKPTVNLALPAAPTTSEILSRSTVSAEYAKEIADKAAAAQAAASAEAQRLAEEASSAAYWFKVKLGGGIFGALLIAGLIGFLIYWFGYRDSSSGSSSNVSATLTITKATHSGTDVTSQTQAKITGGNSLVIPPSIATNLDLSGSQFTGNYSVQYTFSDDGIPYSATFADSAGIMITPTNRKGYYGAGPVSSKGPVAPLPQAKAPGSSMWSRVSSYFSGSGDTGDQLPNAKDAKAQASVSASSVAPNTGAYGYQWWMYVNDWDYKYGHEKHVMSRSDPGNSAIVNPSVMLHPTENTLQIAVSVYDSGDDNTPANASTPNADKFVCEVPDIPLQSWFSVSLTLFERNLDVYINGKLVKSCLLPGVPKQVVGNVDLNNNGGFSGYLCNFYSYGRMLVPTDAQAFYTAGSSCSNIKSGSPSLANALTNSYSIKFGLTDTTGRQVDSYTF